MPYFSTLRAGVPNESIDANVFLNSGVGKGQDEAGSLIL